MFLLLNYNCLLFLILLICSHYDDIPLFSNPQMQSQSSDVNGVCPMYQLSDSNIDNESRTKRALKHHNYDARKIGMNQNVDIIILMHAQLARKF